jgi:phosphatidylglycerol lysyltransferase
VSLLPRRADAGHDLDRQRAFAIVREHGWNATSFQVLTSGFCYWFGGSEGCVAHVDTGGAWVVAGAPLASEGALSKVASDFVGAAQRASRRVAFFGTEQRFTLNLGFRHLLIGEQPVWDPRCWDETLGRTRSLREQLRRGRAQGIEVTRESGDDIARAPLRGALERLIRSWADSKRLPPMGFLVRVDPFGFAGERRFFVARRAGIVVGFAAAVPVYARRGWLLEAVVRAPSAPNGTTELLVDAAMRDAASLGSAYLTLGLAPLAGHVAPLLRLARRAGGALYDFAGLRAFKAKFRPRLWVPIYLSYPSDQSATAAIYDTLVAFAGRGLLVYGASAFWRSKARGSGDPD